MAAQSAREQEVRDQFDAWSIGERCGKPLGKFGSALVQRVRIEPITVMPVKLSDDFGQLESQRTPSGSPLPESESADHLGVVIGGKAAGV